MKNPRPSARVAILGTRGVPARYGGFETFAEELGTRLVKAGVEVTVYCERGVTPGPQTHEGIELRYLPPGSGPGATILFDLRSLWNARKGFDIVYMLGYGAAAFCFIPRLFGRRVWINVDGVEWKRAKWGWFARAYFKAMEFACTLTVDRIIADAANIRRHLEARHRRMPPCAVIPYGAHIVENAPSSSMLDEFGLRPRGYFLVVCRLEPENHVREIIEGHKLADAGVPLVIVGDHKANTAYVRQLLGIASDRVIFVGTVYDKDRLSALRCYCLAYLHGHSVGGTNPSLLEAMGTGNVVVAHDNPFNREVLGDPAFFFGNARDLADWLSHVAAAPAAELESMGYAAKQRVRDIYSWERITDEYLRLIHQEIAAHPHSARSPVCTTVNRSSKP